MADEFVVTKAVRRAIPTLTSLSGTSGSGKTFSGLLLAAGLAGDTGKVGMLDAENGRGTLYEDDPDIRKALPGYEYVPISAPYSPARYTKGLLALEAAGCTVALVDSTTHEWEGEGGAADIAENNKLRGMPNWALAKKEHKRFMAYCMSSRMHIVFCLRAREKTKIVKDDKGKEQFVQMGIQPIAEKNFVFEMLLSLMFDEASHRYTGIKVPKMLASIFRGGELITKAHGVAIRQWADGGQALGENDLLFKRASASAVGGKEAYRAFFAALTAKERQALVSSGRHEENKFDAEQADATRTEGTGDLESQAVAS